MGTWLERRGLGFVFVCFVRLGGWMGVSGKRGRKGGDSFSHFGIMELRLHLHQHQHWHYWELRLPDRWGLGEECIWKKAMGIRVIEKERRACICLVLFNLSLIANSLPFICLSVFSESDCLEVFHVDIVTAYLEGKYDIWRNFHA